MNAVLPQRDASFHEPTSWPALQPEWVPQSRDWTDLGREPLRAPLGMAGPVAVSELVDPRAALPKEPLNSLAQSWMRELPFKLRPGLTAQCHPHVVNRLAAEWDDPARLQACFNELLLSSRIDRKGFALEVLDELFNLQLYSQEPRRR